LILTVPRLKEIDGHRLKGADLCVSFACLSRRAYPSHPSHPSSTSTDTCLLTCRDRRCSSIETTRDWGTRATVESRWVPPAVKVTGEKVLALAIEQAA